MRSPRSAVAVVIISIAVPAVLAAACAGPPPPGRGVLLCAERELAAGEDASPDTRAFSLTDAVVVADGDRRLPTREGGCTSHDPRFELEVAGPDGAHAFLSVARIEGEEISAPAVVAAAGATVSVDVDFAFGWPDAGSMFVRDDAGPLLAVEQQGTTTAHDVGPIAVSLGAAEGEPRANGCADVVAHALDLSADTAVSVPAQGSDALVVDGATLVVENLSTATVAGFHSPCPPDGGVSDATTWIALRR